MSFVDHYLIAALWSSNCSLPCMEDELVDNCMDVDEDHPLYGISEDDHYDAHFDIGDFDNAALAKALHDCRYFIQLLEKTGLYEKALEYQDDDNIAHDFWLTRNGHGAGFWDGDYGDIGGDLTKVVQDYFGECYIFIHEDGESLGLE